VEKQPEGGDFCPRSLQLYILPQFAAKVTEGTCKSLVYKITLYLKFKKDSVFILWVGGFNTKLILPQNFRDDVLQFFYNSDFNYLLGCVVLMSFP
jgi:hypothetical protein